MKRWFWLILVIVVLISLFFYVDSHFSNIYSGVDVQGILENQLIEAMESNDKYFLLVANNFSSEMNEIVGIPMALKNIDNSKKSFIVRFQVRLGGEFIDMDRLTVLEDGATTGFIEETYSLKRGEMIIVSSKLIAPSQAGVYDYTVYVVSENIELASEEFTVYVY